MREKGTHTWDLFQHYFCCPSCSYIFEERKDYTYRLGSYIKELECPRCRHSFVMKKPGAPTVTPFFGGNASQEMEWGDR